MRIYLVVMDETEEAKQALRFASLRAMKTGGSVHILALVPQQTFNAFGGVPPRNFVRVSSTIRAGSVSSTKRTKDSISGPNSMGLNMVIS